MVESIALSLYGLPLCHKLRRLLSGGRRNTDGVTATRHPLERRYVFAGLRSSIRLEAARSPAGPAPTDEPDSPPDCRAQHGMPAKDVRWSVNGCKGCLAGSPS